MTRVAIIGHFGGEEQILDGQTVKTRILYDSLIKYTDFDVKTVDTYYKNKMPFKLFVNSLIALITCKHIIILLSGRGMNYYFPLLFVFAKIFNKKIYHDVIGGTLGKYVKTKSFFKEYVSSFVVNWVETKKLKDELIGLGINNVDILPNFKNLNIVDLNKRHFFSDSFRFCTFSRIMKEKGIEEAIDAVKQINKEGKYHCYLDIYGQVDKKQTKWFEDLKKEFTKEIKYCGFIPFDESVRVLKDYYALLFSTNFKCEGVPGTIIDAFCSGLPVIATKTSANSEIVKNFKTGLLYSPNEINGLKDKIYFLIQNKSIYSDMCKNCVVEAQKYLPEENIKRIKEVISEQ